MDFFIDNTVKRIIGEIITNKNTIPDTKTMWKSLTRRMFHNYPAVDVWSWVEEALAEASDEDWFEKKWEGDRSFKKRDYDYKQPQKKSAIKLNLKQSRIKKQINDNLKISDVAKSYGIILKGKKALCSFHKDSEPSLVFYDKTNTFKCYGCKAKGDIVEFIRRLENGKT